MKKNLSLKQIWTTLILFVVMVPVTIMMSWYGLQLYNNQLNSALMIERQANELLQIRIESEVKRLKTLLENKSDPFALLMDEIENPDVLMDINALLGLVVEREPAIHEVIILSRQAEALAAVDPAIGATGDRILSAEELQAVVDHWEFYTGKELAEVIIPSFGREYIGSPRKHEDFIGFTMATPIGKPVKAILVALVDIRKLWPEGPHKHGPGEEYSRDYMLDRRGSLLSEIQNTDYKVGTLMTHLPIARAALVDEEWLSDTPYIGVDMQFVYGTKTEIPLLHWTLISEVIASKITQPIWEILFKTFLIALFILVVLVLIVLWLAKKTLKPIEQACEAIAHVAQGDFHFTLQPSGISELDMMSSGFNEMAMARKNAEALLLKREQDLLITLNSIGDAVITTDAEGSVIRMNPVAEKLTGWLLEDAKGQPIKTIFPIIDASTRESIENPVDKVLETGEIVYLTNNTTLVSKQGIEYQISDTAAPILNKNNETIGMVLVFNDVTENYQLRMTEKKMGETIRLSEQHLRLYRDQSPVAMIEWNIDCQVVDWNQAAEELFGYTLAEVKGCSFHDFLLPESVEIQVSEIWNKLISGAGGEASVKKI